MAIVKTVFQVIILHEKGDDITKHDLPYILAEMDTGEYLGQVKHIRSTIIPTRDAVKYIRALSRESAIQKAMEN